MPIFDVLGDPIRRRILEILADGEHSAGSIAEVVRKEFGISQPGVSQHLRILREHGLADVRIQGTRRMYSIRFGPLLEMEEWLDRFRRFWEGHLQGISTELERGRDGLAARDSDDG